MVDFMSGDSEFENFLKATNFIQDYTRRLLERSTKQIVKIPNNLMAVNQLTWLVKKYMAEQQELVDKVNKVQETQISFNNLVKEQLDRCRCGIQPHVKSMITSKPLNLHEVKREDGSEFTLKMPSTSNFPVYFDPTFLNLEAEAQQQRIDLELLKMMESVSSPFAETSSTEDGLHMPFLIESPDSKRKGSFKQNSRKRPATNDTQIGPFPCHHCDKTFRQKHGLSQHLLTHESNGAFECDGCGKRYSRQESVYRHQRSTQCTKYQTLTNVRHDEGPGPSMVSDPKSHLTGNPSTFLL